MDTVHPSSALPWYTRLAHGIKELGAIVAAVAVLLGPMVYVGVQLGKAEERFNAIDQRFKEVDRRFDAVDKRFEAIDKRFDRIEQTLEQMVKSQARTEALLEGLRRR
jgi:Tfp pilus assembly protein PilN